MSGMVFLSGGFVKDSAEYNALTALVSTVVLASTSTFMLFVGIEVFKAIKNAKQHEASRVAEAERVEKAMLAAARKTRMMSLAKRMAAEGSGDDSSNGGDTGDGSDSSGGSGHRGEAVVASRPGLRLAAALRRAQAAQLAIGTIMLLV
jgi:hypothetical protein